MPDSAFPGAVQLRLATAQDLPAMREIYRPYVEQTTVTFEYDTPSPQAFAARFAAVRAAFPWYVAVRDGAVLGYAYAAPAFERAAFCWNADLSVYLRADAHRQGIGRALYARLEEDLRALGYCTAYALITAENAGSIAFHEALGYRRCATLPAAGYKLGRWLDLAWYEKALRPRPACPQPPRPFAP